VSFGNYSVSIGELTGQVTLEEDKAKIVRLQPEPTLTSLAQALRSVGATTSDLISILEALKKAGALTAEVEII
jgi:flagellar P-ring protein precursor FlgI